MDSSALCPVSTDEVCYRDKTLGIVGYGDIGRATAGIGRAFRMKIVALRRRVQLSDDERKQGLQVPLLHAIPRTLHCIPENSSFCGQINLILHNMNRSKLPQPSCRRLQGMAQASAVMTPACAQPTVQGCQW